MNIQLRADIDKVKGDLGLALNELRKATVRALNRTAGTGRKDSASALQREYPGLKVRDIKKRVRQQNATQQTMLATLTYSGRRFVLYGNFGMRPLGKWGVSFRGLPWRVETISGEPVTQEMLKRAFRQRSRRSGRADVYARSTPVRSSFELLVAPGLSMAMSERHVDETLKQSIRTRFPVVLRQEAKFVVSKR